MSNDHAYAMFLIRQRQARDISEQHQLYQFFLTFLRGEMSAEEYERELAPTAPAKARHAR